MIRDEARLLALEVDAIHGLDRAPGGAPARLRDPAVLALWAWSPTARLAALGPALTHPEPLDDTGQPYAPELRPEPLVRLAASLGERAVTLEGGPCFVFPTPLPDPGPAPLPVLVSDDAGRTAARRLVRPDNWRPGEWAELIDGAAGAWAMAVHDGRPVSICHTPAAGATTAEAGIWTRADFRGRGLAPVVVAAWSRRARPGREALFYSTTAANHASRSVARRLRLTPLGWLWRLRAAAEGQ
ncbi:GNAT family N-acetyltransferase [Streptomyces catenulae]|uniref:GNAT family N-acetyltransferase n=1 Tax=Streptomyces catenulae TaxID=66875 RepID=A0ABV2YV79_9ACTN|nr:GNAT family N-acetyltransferase [Streptomyces catenulae]